MAHGVWGAIKWKGGVVQVQIHPGVIRLVGFRVSKFLLNGLFMLDRTNNMSTFSYIFRPPDANALSDYLRPAPPALLRLRAVSESWYAEG